MSAALRGDHLVYHLRMRLLNYFLNVFQMYSCSRSRTRLPTLFLAHKFSAVTRREFLFPNGERSTSTALAIVQLIAIDQSGTPGLAGESSRPTAIEIGRV